MSIVACPAQQGPGNHVHQFTYENFMPLSGRWRIFWGGDKDEQHVDLEQWDMVSVPRAPCGASRTSPMTAPDARPRLRRGKLDNDVHVPDSELNRLREKFGDQHGEMIDRIAEAQAAPTWPNRP